MPPTRTCNSIVRMLAANARLPRPVLLPPPLSRRGLLRPPAELLGRRLPLPQQLLLALQEHRQAALLHCIYPAAQILRAQ